MASTPGGSSPEVVNLSQKLSLFNEQWSPKIVGQLNDAYIKVVKLKGEFVWHQHEHDDELFLVVKGTLRILLRDGELMVHEGEFAVVPKGVEHCPVAEEEVHAVLIEPTTVVNTGEVRNERTVEAPDWI